MKIYRISNSTSTQDIAKVLDAKYPRANGMSDGRVVRKEIPNTSSISASLLEYEEVLGVRDIPMSEFHLTGKSYSVSENLRIKRLAEQIMESGEINPLIAVYDNEGLYILEGGHRAEALFINGAKSLPALIIIDREALPKEQQ